MSTKLKLLAVDVARISDSAAITPSAKTLPGIHKLRRLYRFGATVAGFRTE